MECRFLVVSDKCNDDRTDNVENQIKFLDILSKVA
jgi:hypothetical protein